MARRTPAATPVVVFVVWVALVASCTNGGVSSARYGSVEFSPGEGPLVRSRMVRIDSVRTATEADKFTVGFTGGRVGDIMANPCHTDYELDVDEATLPPTVTVWQVVPSTPPKPLETNDVAIACTAEGHAWELQHQWRGDPATEIADGSNDQKHAVLNVAGLLAADVLPEGWAVKDSDAPHEPNARTTRFTDGTSTAFMRVTLHEDPIAVLLTIRTVPDFTEIVIRDGTRAEASTFEGRPQLRFVEGNYLYQLSADQEVAPGVLLDIAEGLSE